MPSVLQLHVPLAPGRVGGQQAATSPRIHANGLPGGGAGLSLGQNAARRGNPYGPAWTKGRLQLPVPQQGRSALRTGDYGRGGAAALARLWPNARVILADSARRGGPAIPRRLACPGRAPG